MLAEWRSASMECGGQCVVITGIKILPESCAGNFGTMSMQEEVCWYINWDEHWSCT